MIESLSTYLLAIIAIVAIFIAAGEVGYRMAQNTIDPDALAPEHEADRRAVTIVDAEELGGAITEKLAELFTETHDAPAPTRRRKLHS